MQRQGKIHTLRAGHLTSFAARYQCHARRASRRAALVAAVLALSAPAAAVGQGGGTGLAGARASAFNTLTPGGWSWFTDPRAVHYSGSNERTYVGSVSLDGRVVVASYDRQTHVRADLGTQPGLDDHDNPALLVLPGGRLMAFYSHHNGGPMRYRMSRRPEDVTAWGPEQVLPRNAPGPNGWTYPNPVRLSREGRIYLFWRGGDWNPTFATLRPDGHWSRARTLIRVPGARPYVKFASNGRDSIYFAFTRSHPMEGRTGIYFARYSRGSFFGARGGRRIGTLRSLPLRPAQADVVYRPRRGQSNGWVHDVALSRRHRPVIVYAVFRSAGDHVYRYARWNGRRWESHTITRAGGSISLTPTFVNGRVEIYYSPGISLDHGDPSVVYLSRQRGRFREIERWRTSDGGRSWRRRSITEHSTVDNIRPVVPRGLAPGQQEVVWMRGPYTSYVAFQTDIRAWLARTAPPRPVADFQAVASAKRTLRFERTVSDGGSAAVSATWSFGDGTSAQGRRVEHRYPRPGTYFPKLTVVDALGRRDVLVQEVQVP